MKEISIIIVTFNSNQCIEYCLDSIFNQGFKDYEVIVVDNASKDSTKLILKNCFPNIKLVENTQNLGFSKALNQGIAAADGKFILCLNDDVRLGRDFLMNIHNTIQVNEDVGAIQPKVLKSNSRIDTAGIYLSAFRRFHDIGSGETDGAEFGKQRYVFGACAAAALYRKEALESVKHGAEYFDEDFFCLVEDVDLSWRMQKEGWKILYYPDAACTHVGGVSRNHSKIAQYFSMRNRYLMILKNETLPGFLRYFFTFFAYDVWRNLHMLLVNSGYFLKVSWEVVKLSPKMVKKRLNKNINDSTIQGVK